MRNDPYKDHFKRMQFTTIHLHTPRSINALTRSYQFGHYMSFLKVNKNTFFSKAYNLSMEYRNEMIQKGLVKGYLKLSRKSKNTSKSSKLKMLDFLQKLPKVNYPQNFKFCQMGPFFSFDLILSHYTRVIALAS